MLLNKSVLLTVITVTMSAVTSAQTGNGCAAYPYTDGITVESVDGGTKILSTSSASVSFDDIDSIKDSRNEALLEAKAAIAKFMTESIKSNEVLNKVVNESKSMQGESKQVVRNETITRIKNLSSSAQALLRGVVPLGDCYTKAREVRVTVGIKPETINQAGNLANDISRSVGGGRAGTSQGNGSGATSSGGLQGQDSFSNTKRLGGF